jgi:hypothetical protein
MKTIKILSLLFATGLFMASCSNDDETPEEVNEEETITTMTVTLIPQGGGTTVTFVSRDLDGDGPNAPVITPDDIVLAANTTYGGAVGLLNETETPAENVNEEIEEEADEHQFIFTTGGGLNASTAYADEESDYVSGETGENFTTNNPVGILFTLTTTDASTGTFTVTLRHEPTKPNDGTLAGAGGETDITQTFDVTIE